MCKLYKYHSQEDQSIYTINGESFLEINYFIFIADECFSSPESIFEQLLIYDFIFGFILNIKKLKSLDDDAW